MISHNMFIALLLILVIFTSSLSIAVFSLQNTLTLPSQGRVSYSHSWAIIGPKEQIPEMKNLFWIFGNQSIDYTFLYPSQIVNYDSIRDFSGLVIWSNANNPYNSAAIRQFAATKPVISHIYDFCHYLYPTLSSIMQTVSVRTVTYSVDWGNFRRGDEPEMHDGTNYLISAGISGLSTFTNITVLAKVDTSRAAFFYMRGSDSDSGFYVMDLRATRSNSYESGNYHIFPVIAKTATVAAGRYSRWLTDGVSWRPIEWVYSWITNFSSANSDIVKSRTIGSSVQGRPIRAIFVGNGSRYFIADGAIHGDEKSGAYGIIRFSELLVEWYRDDPSWRNKLKEYTIILVPVLNPDGYVADTRENAHGKDLNRQFPPGSSTTEPEAWALRWLMGNYTPTQYVNLHADGPSYPMYVFYAGSSVDPYRSYMRSAVVEGNSSFADLGHWGNIYDTVWTGSYTYIGPSGASGMSNEYAFYQHKAAALLVEHFTQNRPWANLQAQDFYVSALLSLLLHYDRSQGLMLYSNAFIAGSMFQSTTELSITLDTENIAGNRPSQTKIYDFDGRGKPLRVYIDGVQRLEGDGWSWSSSASTTTVNDADYSILMVWSTA